MRAEVMGEVFPKVKIFFDEWGTQLNPKTKIVAVRQGPGFL